ncbi:MAG TPA: nucleotidyltransferase family protein [Dongiaceae bacterium]|jgi:MurNAc alpha-1-phosphate uridylyltransferase|nr:nucleotidyltransferase family protein [Dongiaceae bacterium]
MTADAAMVMAAGLGTRLRPFTATSPKAMVPVQGKPIIDHVLDRLAREGIARAIVNLHHLGDVLRAHLVGRKVPHLTFSDEPVVLETGGGLKQAMPLLGPDPFFTINAKIIWSGRPLASLRAGWNPEAMDALLLLIPREQAVGYEGPGDFALRSDGRLHRRGEDGTAPHVYSGISLCHAPLLAETPAGAFSLNLPWDRAMRAGRLFGLVHDGDWFQISTLNQWQTVERVLAEREIAL